MLQNIRDNIQGTIAKVIIALIIVPFAFFGVESLIGGGGKTNVAIVNGEDVSEVELLQLINMQKRRLLAMMGDNVNPSLLDDAVLRGPAMQSLIDKKLLLQNAQEHDVAVPEPVIDQYIVSTPDFQEDGRFSSQRYQNVLRSNGMSPAFYKQSLVEELTIQQINQGVAGSSIVTPKELAQVAAMLGESRSFRYLTVPLVNSADVVISDQQIQDYYQQNQQRFQQSEQVKLNYIDLTLEDFIEPVPEEKIRDVYAAEAKSFTAATERRVSHILLELNDNRDEQQADELISQLKTRLDKGEPFEELVKAYSDDLGSVDSGGDLGFTDGKTFPEPFEDALANLEVGQVTVVKTDAGIHLIKLTEIKANEMPSYAERKPAIERQLQKAEAEPRFVAAVEELKDRVFNADSLTAPASAMGVSVRTSDWLEKGTESGLFQYPAIAGAAFGEDVLQQRHNSEVIELAPDRYVVVHIADYREAAVKPLAEVADTIREQLIREQLVAQTAENAAELLAKYESGESIEELAKTNGLQWQVHQLVKRRSNVAEQKLIDFIFSLPHPDQSAVSSTLVLANGDVAVVSLEAVKPGSVEALSQAEKNALVMQMKRQAGAQSMRRYADLVRQQADIKIM